jgi:hypothetical protein
MKRFYKELDRLMVQETEILLGTRSIEQTVLGANVPEDNLLFFPRRKVRMQKIRSGSWEPRARFIKERLKEKATGLILPTDVSGEGISSGLRSAIVLEGKDYWRLKGVALKTYETQNPRVVLNKKYTPDRRGLCEFSEAFNEQVSLAELDLTGFPRLGAKAGYMESFLPPRFVGPRDELVEFLNEPKVNLHLLPTKSRENINHNMRAFRKILEDVYPTGEREIFRTTFVSALKISGDTRLDEAFYELTKYDLTGKRKLERDELMRTLSFQAGCALALLNYFGFAWSQKLDATNGHIGNFVLQKGDKGLLSVCMTDFGTMAKREDFFSLEEFHNYASKEVESFFEDFFSESTVSPTTNLRYRFFPYDLREQCFDCFNTGYTMSSFVNFTRHKNPLAPGKANIDSLNVVVPKQPFISERDFREKIDYIMKG